MADEMIDASEIEVTVKQGEVTLKGSVDNRWAKRRVEDLAEQVMGVHDVMNQVRVEPSSRARQQDASDTQGSGARSGSSERATTRSEDQPTGTNGRRRATTTSR